MRMILRRQVMEVNQCLLVNLLTFIKQCENFEKAKIRSKFNVSDSMFLKSVKRRKWPFYNII